MAINYTVVQNKRRLHSLFKFVIQQRFKLSIKNPSNASKILIKRGCNLQNSYLRYHENTRKNCHRDERFFLFILILEYCTPVLELKNKAPACFKSSYSSIWHSPSDERFGFIFYGLWQELKYKYFWWAWSSRVVVFFLVFLPFNAYNSFMMTDAELVSEITVMM